MMAKFFILLGITADVLFDLILKPKVHASFLLSSVQNYNEKLCIITYFTIFNVV